ncbi:hypothetical protein [Dermatophilus congolensis]|uniref:hypothetical protein n=1 Tax=Dermatophilus congolensis TaxID=1863 RepID=UPI001AAF1307|nr:hypothetical protein [Dermatophilus congolensis]MBO3129137.1 hypothetical protein [Dermatophilus congolensis]MBO3132226.1 hypothetical protein [Dermatophilus congolensis]MBO3133613.1 hypothetical protein [Dermatophilus congolensis]MBO3135846.1 hypothetical protein [Dermatophilus congolensis]MBO3138088.1 hypothetical protein [Dermatophilus congolensis]
MSFVTLADEDALSDVATFVARARVLVPDGYVRLQTAGSVLMSSVLVRSGSGLLGSGTVVGMRGTALGQAVGALDVTVDLSAVADRLARMRGAGWLRLDVPPVLRQAPWAAVSPPRGGWSVIGEFAGEDVAFVAESGLARVQRERDGGADAAALTALDKQVWDESVGEGMGQFRAALALGVHALGFGGQGPVRLLRHGSWTRLSTAAGDVIGR